MFTGTVASESIDMLLCHFQSNEACSNAYTYIIFRCEISEIKLKVHAITTIILQTHYVRFTVYIHAKHFNKITNK